MVLYDLFCTALGVRGPAAPGMAFVVGLQVLGNNGDNLGKRFDIEATGCIGSG
jgi:hypothetical protein